MDAQSPRSTSPRPGSPAPVVAAALVLAAATVAAAITAAGAGPRALLYLLFFAATAAPGLPVGFALFGRRHAAGWIAGALLGYVLTAVALWIPVDLGQPSPASFLLSWAALGALALPLLRVRTPAVALPMWHRRDTRILLLLLLVVPALAGPPFARFGSEDALGNRRYRAYFTADVVWHTALTAELAKFQSPPRNPYLARRPLHYYWIYFVPPAVASAAGPRLPSVAACVLVNALCAGLLFVAALHVAAWCLVPRSRAVAAAVALVVLAASAEGVYAMYLVYRDGAPLGQLRQLNVDAMTLWSLFSLTVDGIPRGLWYTPQHSAACACGLLATAAAAAPVRRPLVAALGAGTALGLSFILSPFPGGVFVLIFALTVLWTACTRREPRLLVIYMPAAVPLLLYLWWALAHQTFTGGTEALSFGLHPMVLRAPLLTAVLALGPALALVIAGALMPARGRYPAAAALGVIVGLGMFYFASLDAEPIWIGWRAGQVALVSMPALVARFLCGMSDAGRRPVAVMVFAAAFAVGLPTTIVDAWNAQDVRNRGQAPGFRWTVLVSATEQAALAWIREHTPTAALVQMSIAPRGRETWSLIPTFAERRMAAGQPISLLRSPGDEYDVLSKQVDSMYAATDAAEAARIARALRIRYIYVDSVEHRAFGPSPMAKFDDALYFTRVFRSGAAAVYEAR